MKQLSLGLIFGSFIFLSASAPAQNDPSFEWVSGSDTTNQLGVFGTVGVAAATNVPGARENSQTWTDDNNNLWLFGGHGYAQTATQGYLNDLWKFDSSTSQWTWISGNNSTNQNGVYGTINVSAPANKPGARQNSVTWKDDTGNLWLFGGQGYAVGGGLSYLNDLWKFDVGTNQWTWVSGSNLGNQTGSYGTLGTSSPTNVPCARFGAVAWQENNHLWLFGGQSNNGAVIRLNDLWKFDIGTNEWTWISGANVPDQNGTYGTLGTSAPSNAPGARQAGVSWLDNSGDFWFFGGYGFPATGSHGYMDDLWKYNVAANEWTWVNGTNVISQPGVYGTQDVASSANIPCARQMSVAWKSQSGDLFLFGGWGFANPTFGRISDLWKYSIATNQWTWIAGPNLVDQPGIYGTQGVPSVSNIPGARRMSTSWVDLTGNFWLFGGYGFDGVDTLGLQNDLWKINLDPTASVDEFTESDWSVFPVPFNEQLNVAFNDDESHRIQIIDYSGKIVYSNSVVRKATIDLNYLTNGIYFIRVDESVKKIIKS